jgi:hypothetical protein
MSEQEDRQRIFNDLKEYSERYNADYYLLILAPDEGQRVRVPGNYHKHSDYPEESEIGPAMDILFAQEVQRRIDAIR